MALVNKVSQFNADIDLVSQWVHGAASGVGSEIVTDSGTVPSPAKIASTIESTLLGVISNNFTNVDIDFGEI